MQNDDFKLSEQDLERLNEHVQRVARSHYLGEGEPANDVVVTFMFGPPFGRVVTVSVAGSEPIELDDLGSTFKDT